MITNGPLVLIIRDGWGMNPYPRHDAFNAVKLASQRGLTPVADRLMREYPWTLIKTSGEDVGIPDGTMGNSEVGHQNIGAGRVVDQESVAITKACRPPRGLHENAVVTKAITRTIGKTRADGTPSVVHLLCICSDAGVHGQLEHLFAMVRACKVLGQSHVAVHLITDGRDTGPYTAGGGIDGPSTDGSPSILGGFVERVERELISIGVGRVQSVMGRYFAMDRDNRWERVQLAYECLVGGGATPEFDTAKEALRHAYANPPAPTMLGDEFVTPCRIGTMDQWQPMLVRDGDSVVFVNYRGDRPREISAAFVLPDDLWAKVKPSPDSGRHGFARGKKIDLHYVIMTEYWDALLPHVSGVIFPKPPRMRKILGEHISALGLTQFRCAETEKYPHVTFFFNDYREEPFPGEQRQNPQSPKVATYDLKPEMSADQVRDAVLAQLAAPDCQDVIIVNFANGDMVGHTGSLEATIKACATVDACVGEVIKATLARGGQLIVTADHGNAEQMFDPETNAPHTAHTTFDVPLILVSERLRTARLRGDQDPSGWFSPPLRAQRGRLGDIAPTLLHMGNLPVPTEMEGTSLIVG